MHNTALNIDTTTPIINHAEVKATFKDFVFNPKNQPYKDKTYGTKYAGRASLIHFMAYAYLRGKPMEIATHNPRSSKYQSALETLRWLSNEASATPNASASVGRVLIRHELDDAFGLDAEQWVAVLKERPAII